MNAPSTEEVILELKELTQGMYYLSESDYPLEVVHFEQAGIGELTKEEVLSLTSHSPEELIEIKELASFFRNVTAVSDTGKPAILQEFIKQQLKDTKVYWIGKREKKVYVLGSLPYGSVAGIKTTAIEVS